MSELLLAAARAYALVSMADGALKESEGERFFAFAAGEPLLAGDAREAFGRAVLEAMKASEFDDLLPVVAAAPSSPAERAALLRAGQAALVADGVNAPQENAALHALATALGLEAEEA